MADLTDLIDPQRIEAVLLDDGSWYPVKDAPRVEWFRLTDAAAIERCLVFRFSGPGASNMNKLVVPLSSIKALRVADPDPVPPESAMTREFDAVPQIDVPTRELETPAARTFD